MSDGYAVNVEALGQLITTLETATERIAEANRRLKTDVLTTALGSTPLAESGNKFEETWAYGIEQLGEAATEVGERLKVTKQRYQNLEEEHQRLFAKIQAPGGAPSAPTGLTSILGGGA